MIAPRWRLAVAAAALVLVLPVACAARPAHAATPGLRLADQTFSTMLGRPLTFDLAPDPSLDVRSTDVVHVVVHEPVEDRDGTLEVIDGVLTDELASVDVPVGSITVDADGVLQVELAVDPEGSEGSLEVSSDGLHPVSIELRRDDEVLGGFVTFVELIDDDAPPGSFGVGLVAQVSGPPTLQPDLTTTVDPVAKGQLEALATLLEETEQTVSVGLGAELLAGLERSGEPDDLELLDRLDAGLRGRELLAETYVSIDPSGAARSTLADEYTAQLRLGEDTLAELLPRLAARRSVYLARTPVDGRGAELLRDLGARTLVLLPAAQAATGSGFALVADPTLLLDVSLPDAAPIPAVIVEARLSEQVGAPTADPVLTAHHLMAQVVALRDEIVEGLVEDGADDDEIARTLAGRSLLLATPSGRVPDPTLGATLLDLVAATPGFSVTTATEAGATMDPFVADAERVQLPLPEVAGPDLLPLASTLLELELDTTSTASMLPEDDPRPLTWEELERVLVAGDLADDERTLYVDAIRSDVGAIRSSVVLPEPATFTLGGRSSTIRLKLTNDADVPLRVLVRLRSAKLTFPEGDPVVELAPRQTTEVPVPVEARSNGTFPVTLEVVTPEGGAALGPLVVFTARVTALAGLGQVISVGALLVLATWWVHHLRVRRRQRRADDAEPSSRRHPSSGTPDPSEG